MEFYGISGTVNKLMRSYLENRYQRISTKDSKFNKVYSKWEHIKHGVPQGLILGLLLFLIYINDFSSIISKIASPVLFADNMNIIISHTNPQEFKNNINMVLIETVNWFQSNFLTLNCDKTHFLQFLTNNTMKLKCK
jgi:hypothetical protein